MSDSPSTWREEYLAKQGYTFDPATKTLSGVESIESLVEDLMGMLTMSFNWDKPIGSFTGSGKEKFLAPSSPTSSLIKTSPAPYHNPVQLPLEKYPFTITSPFTYVDPDPRIKRATILKDTFGTNLYPLTLSPITLTTLLNKYDSKFFGGMISDTFNQTGGGVTFEISSRMTSSGGSCRRVGICKYEIKISSHILAKIHPTTLAGQEVNGLKPSNRAEALLLIFEHELIHMVLSMFVNDIESHGPLFKSLAKNLFGHSKTTHSIISGVDGTGGPGLSTSSSIPKTKSDFRVGDLVLFFKGRSKERVEGRIEKLNPKRAKINTVSGVYAVPYGMLIKL